IVSGTATIADTSSPTTGVTVAAGDTVTLRWTISNGSCTDSTDDVVLTNDALPTTAAAGTDQTQCNTPGFTMAANTPTVGTGIWSIVSGTATIADTSSPTTGVTVAAGDTVTLRWTISNGSCTDSTDDVVLTNDALPVAGLTSSDADNTICAGESVTFTGTGGDAYEFFIDGVSVQAESATATYTTAGLSNGQEVTVRVVNTTTGCESLSTGIIMSVNVGPDNDSDGISDDCDPDDDNDGNPDGTDANPLVPTTAD
ncbi:hypothetical protein, partial [Tenacibaculum sp. IB213877]|uniref:hypothetical protein n=1 Tax=Tenacibaculum sp. IB213877 TaxID=3097351 RepID=UPI002A5AE8BE